MNKMHSLKNKQPDDRLIFKLKKQYNNCIHVNAIHFTDSLVMDNFLFLLNNSESQALILDEIEKIKVSEANIDSLSKFLAKAKKPVIAISNNIGELDKSLKTLF